MPNMSLKKNVMPTQPADERNKNFNEVALGYTAEQAIDEASLRGKLPGKDPYTRFHSGGRKG